MKKTDNKKNAKTKSSTATTSATTSATTATTNTETTMNTNTSATTASLGSAKVAIVDVQALINQTPAVLALRAEQQKNASIIQNWINSVNNQLNQIADQNTRVATAQQYQIELNKRQQMLQSQYATKIQEIDMALSKLVSDVASEKKLDYVFAKNMVVFGGTDITADIAALLKK